MYSSVWVLGEFAGTGEYWKISNTVLSGANFWGNPMVK